MRVLQIGNTDVMGTRFNGHDLHLEILKRGIQSQHCVWDKKSDDTATWTLTDNSKHRVFNRLIETLEKRLSLQSMFLPYSWKLPFDERFRLTDIVHYHLIHTGFFSLPSLPFLTRNKPSVWTLHDPWAITGHCVHPFTCEKWKTGCGDCPNLTTHFAMRNDRTALMYNIKKITYHKSNLDIVLASKWMLQMARQSPLLSRFRLHHIPFGIDLERFKPIDVNTAKKDLGVFPGSTVIAFRAINGDFKGLDHIKECLRHLNLNQPVCLLTFNDRGLVDEFRGKYQIIDLGWVDDLDLTIKAYNAADMFLMPSIGESFGMMAIEAMACGKPVITFEGTALPEVIFAPDGGIAVEQKDTIALTKTVETLCNNPDQRLRLGEKALKYARQNYDRESYIEKMLGLYSEVIERRKVEKGVF